jgi:hypothetical protein
MQKPPNQHPVIHRCQQTRLAETSVAAIDECSCGMLQLHLGALTVRLAPCAAEELLATLKEAICRRDLPAESAAAPFANCGSTRRGQA